MRKILYILLIVFFILNKFEVFSQNLINTRIKKIYTKSDTVFLDTLSIWSNSIRFYDLSRKQVTVNEYYFDFFRSAIVFTNESLPDTLIIEYKVFPVNYSKSISLFEKDKFLISDKTTEKKYNYIIENNNNNPFSTNNELSRRGSISRGVSFGNNQDVVLNSGLNLQLDGKLNDELYITAAITDNNIPIQPEGNTQHIQEFDKVFIKIYNDRLSVTVGDFELRKPQGYYLNYFKKVQGLSIGVNGETSFLNKALNIESTISGTVSKGRFNRIEFYGEEGNQGPYKLTGANNELNVIVLAGSEKVFVDGILQTRGADNEYVIDYNTGEITFTPKQPINKDKRIIVEFEYSEKSYNRFLITNSNNIKIGESSFYLNFYSEKDNKNSPIDQDLSSYERFLLSEAGDNSKFAVVPAFDSTGFSASEIRYELRDTIVDGIKYDSIFVYSINPNKAFYRVSFSYVGPNKGNYRKSVSSANGRVFEWISPENGIPQGDYTPYKILISPTKKQIVVIGTNLKLDSKTLLKTESAFSNYDKNTFSKKDIEDDNGFAINNSIERSFIQNEKTTLKGKVEYSYQQKNFVAIENFKNPEFTRDWNLRNFYPESDENEFKFSIFHKWKNHTFTTSDFNILKRGSYYDGKMGKINSVVKYNNLEVIGNISVLNTLSYIDKSKFLRHSLLISRKFRYFRFGIGEDAENNQLRNITFSELKNNSFAYQSFNCFIKTSDSSKIEMRLEYKIRNDFLPKNNALSTSTNSDNINFISKLKINNNNNITTTINYRKLEIIDTSLYNKESESNLLGRIEYNFKFLKSVFSGNSFYETGSGIERKLEFSYIEVTPGQGVYKWTDYNGNGIKELDEFDVAHFTDQANYIRIFIPTSEYIKTYINQFSQSININPEAVWSREKGIKKFFSRFSNQFAFRTGTKNNSNKFSIYANPFIFNINDISIVSINQNIRNNFSFNRTNPKFGADYIFQSGKNKILLVSGYDTRNNITHTFQIRYQIIPTLGIQNRYSKGSKIYNSEFFTAKNFSINHNSEEFKIIYQPNMNYRITGKYEYKDKKNINGSETLYSNQGGIELSLMSTGKSIINFDFNVIYNMYHFPTNTPIAYEILEGLLPGINYTWNLCLQRQLANRLQLNIIYNARKSPDLKIIHNAAVQMRAFF